MSRLALRIFGSIWLAFFLLLAGYAALVEPAASDATAQPLSAAQQRQLLQTAERMREVQARRGLEGLRRFARDVHDNRGLTLFLLDADGHDLLGESVPATVHEQWLARGASGPAMQRREHRLLLGPMPFGDASVAAQVLVWLPPSEAEPPAVSRLWGGPRMAVALAIALAASGCVSLGLALSLTRALDRLRRAAQRLRPGRFDVFDDAALAQVARRRDELGELAREFAAMARRLQAAVDSHGRLLLDVSHELRSPLARLQAAIELAHRQADPQARAGFERMEAECHKLDAMIGDVLALSRAGQDEAVLRRAPFDLATTVQALVADAAFEGGPQGKQVRLHAPERLPCTGHEASLCSAIENVLRNALRYTPPGGLVGVWLEEGGDGLRVLVRDTGPGVPEAALERIFEPFYRVAEARERSSGGTGLGLAIAARAVFAHGGTVCARNAVGGGLEIAITLPRVAADGPRGSSR